MFRYLKLLLKSKWSLKNITYSIVTVSVCLVIHVWIMHDLVKFVDSLSSVLSLSTHTRSQFSEIETNHKLKSPIYILFWFGSSMLGSGEGNALLKHLQCPITDCFFTINRHTLSSISEFNAIMFDERILKSYKNITPKVRSPSQIYILSTVESSHNYPACELFLDDFFNWTFTYRIDSNIIWNYFTVKNTSGHVIAPSRSVVWKNSSSPVKPEIKSILAGKTKAAAWLVSHCNADSLRHEYVTRLQEHLFHFSLAIDIYGLCTGIKCKRDDCQEMIKKDYYFYMAFENSFAEDYVTEKVLHGINNYAVPIVYGGADYGRFLPTGSYINARNFHPYRLALKIKQAISEPAVLESYFKWTNLYKIGSPEAKGTQHICRLCEALHNNKGKQTPANKNFRLWWNGLSGMQWCLPNEYWSEKNKMIIDSKDIFTIY